MIKNNKSLKNNKKKYKDNIFFNSNKYSKKRFFFYKNFLKKNKKLFIYKEKYKHTSKKNIIKRILIFNIKIKKNMNENLIVDGNRYNVKFCVFLGREKNIKVLHSYIELGLSHNILNEYHMFDFSRNIEDHDFIFKEYKRLSIIFNNRIFLHNYDENIIIKNNIKTKTDWSPFYKKISKSLENDVIIKCDDDILFIDIFSLKNAIIDRIKDKESFLIHSNCINNGVCAYYQRDLFFKLKEHINKYPTGGILGILFEKPEIAYGMHSQFTNDILLNLENINRYILDDVYINTRISINFILLNGSDAKYIGDIGFDDEYQLSSFIPEKLCRPNKIKGDLITSHLSYSFQEKVLLNRDDILNIYKNIMQKYINIDESLIKNYNNNINLFIPKSNISNNIYKIKNWIKSTNFYIKNIETNQYLFIDYDIDEFNLSKTNKTIFEITEKKNNIIEIKLGIYYLTRYNAIGKFRNESILLKYLKDLNEKEIMKENIDKDNYFHLKFLKYNAYLTVNTKNDSLVDVTYIKLSKWIFEEVNNRDEFIYATRFIKNNKIYYKNINNNEIYTNYYSGWSIENVLW